MDMEKCIKFMKSPKEGYDPDIKKFFETVNSLKREEFFEEMWKEFYDNYKDCEVKIWHSIDDFDISKVGDLMESIKQKYFPLVDSNIKHG